MDRHTTLLAALALATACATGHPVLEDGTVPLPLLDEKIDRWIASAR